MNRKSPASVILILKSIIFSVIFFSSCREKTMDGMIVFTQIASATQYKIDQAEDSSRYLYKAKIAAIDPDRSDGEIIELTDDYFSAMSPEISYDSKFLLFAARQKPNDPWQIFEMNLANRKIKQITNTSENCVDPAYLPNGRLVFSMINFKDSLKSGQSLYTCDMNGTDLKRITFNPHDYSYSTVFKDGRILTISRQVYPEKGDPIFMAMRPDGTKAELFYKGIRGSSLISKGYETSSGKLVFIESSERNAFGSNITSISYNRPLHTHVNLTSGINGDFRFVFPLTSGKLLVSWRSDETEKFGLHEFDPDKKILSKLVFRSNDYDISEAVYIRIHERPKKLPSEVDMGVKTGLLLCQDINILESHPVNNSSYSNASKIEVMGTDSVLGVVDVLEDGSFYLKVIANKPFKIKALDENGKVLNKACGWIWLRPNERRGCVGCHEDHEQVPENRVPLAVKNPPVNIPFHLTKVKGKKVALE